MLIQRSWRAMNSIMVTFPQEARVSPPSFFSTTWGWLTQFMILHDSCYHLNYGDEIERIRMFIADIGGGRDGDFEGWFRRELPRNF